MATAASAAIAPSETHPSHEGEISIAGGCATQFLSSLLIVGRGSMLPLVRLKRAHARTMRAALASTHEARVRAHPAAAPFRAGVLTRALVDLRVVWRRCSILHHVIVSDRPLSLDRHYQYRYESLSARASRNFVRVALHPRRSAGEKSATSADATRLVRVRLALRTPS